MVLYHLEREEKFGIHRLVWDANRPEEGKTETVEAEHEGDKHKVEIQNIKDVDSAGEHLDRQEKEILDGIKALNKSADTRIRGFVLGGRDLKKAVHEYHENEASKLLAEETDFSTNKITRIRHGWIKLWGAPEVALATAKLRELTKTKDTLTSAIALNKSQAAKYQSMLDQFRQSRFGRREYKKFAGLEPGRVKETEKVNEMVKTVETETRGHLKEHDTRMEQKYREYAKDAGSYKNYFFSFPIFSTDEELKKDFDQHLANDQRAGDLSDSEVIKKIDTSSLRDDEKAVLKDLYGKLVQRQDIKMRRMLDARNVREKIAEMTPAQLAKLPVGQDLKIEYARVFDLEKKSFQMTTQGAYVVENTGSVVTMKVRKSDVAKEGKILRQSEYTDAMTRRTEKKEVSYQPSEHTITIDLSSNTITHNYVTKDNAGHAVKISDRGNVKVEEGKFKNLKISAEVSKKIL